MSNIRENVQNLQVDMDEIYGSPDWRNDTSKVLSIELLFRPLSCPIVGNHQDHHALVFSFNINGTNYFSAPD